jgi:carbon monoxide dehydrogenase subunit G
MEHEAFVPFPVAAVRRAFGDPARVARALPGWQPDDPGDSGHPLTGRLRFRANGATITYRGTLRVKDRADGDLGLRADATESRGEGGVRVRLKVRLTEARSPEGDDRPGTRVAVSGRVEADGRAATLDPEAVSAAGHRLLDRFFAALAEEEGGEGAPVTDTADTADDANGPVSAEDAESTDATGTAAADGTDDGDTAPGTAADGTDTDTDTDTESAYLSAAPAPRSPEPEPDAEPTRAEPTDTGATEPTDATGPAAPRTPKAADATGADATHATGDGPDAPLDAATPPDPDDAEDDAGDPEDSADDEHTDDGPDDTDDDAPGFPDDDLADALPTLFPDGLTVPESAAELDDLPTDAAQARRTMIGRSAEEVDHAPPRGRYAPVPAPGADRGVAALALRWAAPAAAVLLVSAAVASRVLRRRT